MPIFLHSYKWIFIFKYHHIFFPFMEAPGFSGKSLFYLNVLKLIGCIVIGPNITLKISSRISFKFSLSIMRNVPHTHTTVANL
jgi:hypothetical protein